VSRRPILARPPGALPDYRYEDHFGGVFYIFIRGVSAEKGTEFGIYKDLPTPELIEVLGRNLIPNLRDFRG